jgi:starch synthase
LAHLIYAGAIFYAIKSRTLWIESNVLIAIRNDSIVKGGLKDTVIDFGDDGNGICHDQSSVGDICYSDSGQ